jgi:hypothetical protein
LTRNLREWPAFLDRVEWLRLRPATLPHHRTCGFPHTAVELSGPQPQDPMALGNRFA